MLLLTALAAAAVCRVRDDRQRQDSLEYSAVAAGSLESAEAGFFEGQGLLAALVWAQDPMFVDMYRQSAANVDEDLAVAREELLAGGEAGRVAAVDRVIQRLGRLEEDTELVMSAVLEAGASGAPQVAAASLPELMPQAVAIRDELDRLVQEEEEAFAAERAAADHASDITVVLLIVFAALTLVGATAMVVMLVVSVVRPIALLRTSVRAVALGNLHARAEVSGPEEVASLAWDFNEMVAERKRAEDALREQARRDPLTGVLNHGAIVEELQRLISGEDGRASHVVAMVDVDGLKVVNDTYGHQVGDAVLLAVARSVSREGAMVGRYGGDEFVALLPGADRAAAERFRDAVLDSLANAGLTDPETGAGVAAAVSIGLVTYPTEAARIEDLIKLADGAMYDAKRARPIRPRGRALAGRLDLDRAAKMVEEIVPLMMSPGDLNAKLRLVARRLSVAAGYQMVHFTVFGSESREATAQSTFAHVADEVLEAWNREQRAGMLHSVLERTRRPIILDDPQHEQHLAAGERELVRAAGVRSVLMAPMICHDEMVGSLSVASKRAAAFGPRDAEFLMAVAAQVAAVVRMATLVEQLQSTSNRLAEAHSDTVMLLAAAAEAHDRTTGEHLRNVRGVTEALARELGYSEEDAREMGLAAVLHDIGKIRVPDIILASAGELSESEWEVLKRHTVWGQEFVTERAGFELAATIAHSHHERWDGSGYPAGLAGDDIPEAATIVAVADSFDAMTSDRPYRPARSVAQAMREIVARSGQQFNPKVVQALVRLYRRKMLPRPHRAVPHEDVAA